MIFVEKQLYFNGNCCVLVEDIIGTENMQFTGWILDFNFRGNITYLYLKDNYHSNSKTNYTDYSNCKKIIGIDTYNELKGIPQFQIPKRFINLHLSVIDNCFDNAPVDFLGTGSNSNAADKEQRRWYDRYKDSFNKLKSFIYKNHYTENDLKQAFYAGINYQTNRYNSWTRATTYDKFLSKLKDSYSKSNVSCNLLVAYPTLKEWLSELSTDDKILCKKEFVLRDETNIDTYWEEMYNKHRKPLIEQNTKYSNGLLILQKHEI